MLYDISPIIDGSLAVWPGDTPPAREVLLDLRRGDSVTLSTLRTTVHAGAHADAPSHYAADGATIERRDLTLYVGACQVLSVDVGRGRRITPGDVRGEMREPRILLKTGTFPDARRFNEDFAGLTVELIDEMHRRGVRLVGIDTPSVDLYDSKDLPAHRRIHEHDMAILEGLLLSDVADGVYELIALPLRLAGFDASPVRAVLRSA